MTELYLLIDQHNQFLDKEGHWIPLPEAKQNPTALFRTPLKDEAINQKVEYIVKNPELRIALTTVPTDDKGVPILEAEDAVA